MAGKTISAYTDEETAALVAELARVEQRTPSQIASAALKLYARLPPRAHDSLRRLEANGAPEDFNLMLREITRAISNASFDAASRKIGSAFADAYGDDLHTDEEIEAEAVRLVKEADAERRAPQSTVLRSKKAADTGSREHRRRRP